MCNILPTDASSIREHQNPSAQANLRQNGTNGPSRRPISIVLKLVMRVRCLHCSAQVELDDRRVKGRKMAQIRCWMCAQSSVVDLLPPDLKSSTIATDALTPQERPLPAARLEQSASARVATLDLPP